MADANEMFDSFSRKYHEKNLKKLIKKDPKLDTNPRMAEWFTLGYYAGAIAQGEVINLIFEMSEPPKPVEDEPEGKEDEETKNADNVT